MTITVSQLANGGNPGNALGTTANDSTNVEFSAKLGLLNKSWTYNPTTQGAIGSIFFSEDKFSNLQGIPLTSSSIRMMIKQNGKTYVAGTQVPGATVDTWQGASATFSATDFELWSFTTGFVDSNEHPDFANGLMQFGVASSPSQSGTQGSPTIYTFNFDNTLIRLNVTTPLETVQTATIVGSAYTKGTKVVKTLINLKTLGQSAGVNPNTKPDRVLVLVSTLIGNNATKRLLVFRKIAGGSSADDVVLLDLSNIDDINNPVSEPIASALDPLGNGYELDIVQPRDPSLFTGVGGESFTTISKGTPQKRLYDVHMAGTVGNVPSVLAFKVTVGKLYVPKP